MPYTERQQYWPSGLLDFAKFSKYGLICIGVGTLIALLLAGLTAISWYAVGWLTVVLVVILAGMAEWTVRQSCCRNRYVASITAGTFGLFLWVGHFHFDQCLRWHVGFVQVESIPGFIAFRMDTDGWCNPIKYVICRVPAPRNPAITPWLNPVLWPSVNWAAFFFELIAVCIVPAAAGWVAANRPFDETISDWCVRERVLISRESAYSLRKALVDERIGDWARQGFERSSVGGEHIAIEVWYTPLRPDRMPSATEVFLGFGRCRPVRLTPEEAAAMTIVLPEVSAIAVIPEENDELVESVPVHPHVARLMRITGEPTGRLDDPQVIYLGRALAVVVFLLPSASIPLLMRLIGLLDVVGINIFVKIGILLVAFMISLAFIQYWNKSNGPLDQFLIWYYRGVLKRELESRKDTLFPMEDDRVVYISMSPRRTWDDAAALTDSGGDIGFALLDEKIGSLLFEGDRHRYVIPFIAIESVAIEEIIHVENSKRNKEEMEGTYAVVVTARVAEGVREFPFIPISNVPGRNRLERAVSFSDALKSKIHSWPRTN